MRKGSETLTLERQRAILAEYAAQHPEFQRPSVESQVNHLFELIGVYNPDEATRAFATQLIENLTLKNIEASAQRMAYHLDANHIEVHLPVRSDSTQPVNKCERTRIILESVFDGIWNTLYFIPESLR